MSKQIIKPGKGQFGSGGKGGSHKASPIPGQMRLGEAHCLQSRSGTFKGTPSDVRKGPAFSGGAERQQRKAGGGHGAGHASQLGGHGKQGKFADTSHKGNTK